MASEPHLLRVTLVQNILSLILVWTVLFVVFVFSHKKKNTKSFAY